MNFLFFQLEKDGASHENGIVIYTNSSLATNGESALQQLAAANDTYEEETVEETKCVAQGGKKEKLKVLLRQSPCLLHARSIPSNY